MFLKKIIISGFKSFADKVVINLDRGITGVVGPNGSGKSNVIDSVRWVMGEQNAKMLRGEKATDIIFAGSERRKSLGMAEVSLVFDNSEETSICPPEYRHESEIALTRRLYADGQREYLINKRPCRLKDIVNFFATTGLGGRSYSMIQQGQVDRILNAKPEDVREIIEEAAGTGVYKKRKEEAQKKLEQTQLNLARIDDILAEVEKQLGTLEEQVQKAKEYQEHSTKLKDEEISLFAHNYHHFREQQEQIKKVLDEALAKEAAALSGVSDLEQRQQELQAMLDESDPEVQALQEKISTLREKIARSEATLKNADNRIDSGTRRMQQVTDELAEDDANLRVLETQVDAARREMADAEGVAAKLNEAIESFEYEVESANEAAQVYQSRMEEFEDEIKNLERLIESNKFRSESSEKELEKTRRDAENEEARARTLKEEMVQLETELAVAEEKAGSTKAGLDKEIREKHEREAAVAERYRQMKEANLRRDELKEKYHNVKARYTSLQELEAGATDVVGDLQKLREKVADADQLVRGLLTDFIGFNAQASELPGKAAAAFERWAERLVVQDLTRFNALVRMAEQHGTGSLPVCVLSQAEGVDRAAAGAWADKYSAEPLRQYLKIDASVPGLDVLIDRLYLLPAIQIDSDVVREMPKGIVVFTSKGVTFTDQDEFVVGGKSVGGLLSRKTEQEQLAAQLKAIEGDLGRATGEIDELEFRINEDRQIVADIDRKLQQQNQGVLEVMQALQAAQQLYDRKRELIETAVALAEKARFNETKIQEESETLAKNRFSLQRELATAKAELETIEQEAESLMERKEETRRQHEGKRLELAKSSARAQALRDGFTQTKAQLELLQNKLSRRYEEKARLEQDVEQAHVELEQAKQDIEQFILEREALQKDFASKREANAGVIEELRVIEGRLKAFRDSQSGLQKTLAEKNVQMERVRMALAGVSEQAIEKYRLDLGSYEFTRDPNFNYESRTRTVQRLRSKIESMGAINMMALKEFDEKSSRRDFIAKQKDEVVSSMELLAAAIGEIEETSLTKFLAAFKQINQEFGALFPILFPTGEARLELTTPDQPLTSGIEILARLPGKSMKAMTLFSGGEKALTAMALIFGLLRSKPTPFCFLDEVDAPLDEANVGRYNRVLEALSSQFQFIVITHNRRTMEVLDTLYGITMMEPGVSKCVGVDMHKDLPVHLRKAFKEEKKPEAVAAGGPRPVEGASVR